MLSHGSALVVMQMVLRQFSEKPTNEMVRRLILCEGRLIVEAASDKEDHRHADTFSWHRSGQDNLSSRGTRGGRQGARPGGVHSASAADIHRDHVGLAERLGGLFGCSLSRPSLAEAGP